MTVVSYTSIVNAVRATSSLSVLLVDALISGVRDE